jgi:N-acetylneuraminic acid mutarotase
MTRTAPHAARRIVILGMAVALLLGVIAFFVVRNDEEATAGERGWIERAAIAGGIRQEHGVAALDGAIYVIAGVNPTNTGQVDVYRPAEDTWSTVAPLPVAMNHPNVAAVDGQIYVVGGMVGTGTWTAVGNVFRYDPATNSWTELAPMPAGTERGTSAVGVAGTKIYLAGGLRTLVVGPGGLQDTVPTFSSYDVATGEWETLPELPQARDHVGGAVVGDTMYVLGGRDRGVENVRGSTYAYDITARVWSERAPMPTARGGVATAVVGEQIYVMGGEGNPTPGAQGVYGENEVYDTTRDSWQQLAPMRTPRHGTAAATVDGTIYVPGGAPMTRLGPSVTNEAYRP